MINLFFKSLSGRHYRKFIRRCRPTIVRINLLDEEYSRLSDEALRGKTTEFRKRVADGETLDSILPEAFAAVKNAARRLCGKTFNVCGYPLKWEMVHYDVQLLGGIALHEGNIAEMATGEGKTLVATSPFYLRSLAGKGCHLVTVNDYLALRDSDWMGNLYNFLDVSVGCIQNQMDPAQRREMYARDITYGTASEFGFDYLRDNGMATRAEDQVQRGHYFAIVDEADSILIDEARTPLIISGPAQEDRPLPFLAMKPEIERLVRAQSSLCNEFGTEARRALEADPADQRAIELAWLIRNGMPKHKQLLKLMEDPGFRKRFEKFDGEINNDFKKQERYKLKEQLFYIIDEKQHQADLTEKGRELLRPGSRDAFTLPDLPSTYQRIDADQSLSEGERERLKSEAQDKFSSASEEIHTISQLLRAYSLYTRDDEYVVQDGKVMIVDENTGRIMPGRRWSEGLHQAVEAKEGVKIEKETKTYATITLQNYFRLYEQLAGMTGTAETEASELHDIYRTNVMVIPTHRKCIREDLNDVVFKTRRAKYNAALKEIEEAHGRGQPVLVGTASVEASELLSRMLKRSKIPHTVLNAKFHAQEADIVSKAGSKGAVTIATNMAGRGTDIKLGEGVEALGGLYVIGTERHESRRIDRQLRGRCARQGDPGTTKFFVSLEDDLMRLFANAGPLTRLLEKSFSEDEVLEGGTLNWSIENAQKKVEQQNFSIRKRLLQYDDVLNRQREIIYEIRNEAIHSENPSEIALEMISEEVGERLDVLYGSSEPDEDAITSFIHWVNGSFPISLKKDELIPNPEESLKLINERIQNAFRSRSEFEDPEALIGLARYVVIRSIDRLWQDHLTEMDELRRSVGLRGYGQKDPLNEYKSEAFTYFEELMVNVRREICGALFRSATNLQAFQNMLARMNATSRTAGPSEGANLLQSGSTTTGNASSPQAPKSKVSLPKIEPVRREVPKVGRNEVVTIKRGTQTQKIKFKKAEHLIRSEGWELVEK
ncbi:MAG: preprotein translocase subunit SecA [Puniceicoccaceae bacterium]